MGSQKGGENMDKKLSATLVITDPEASAFDNEPRVWGFKTRLTEEEFKKIVDETIDEVIKLYPDDWNYEDIGEALLRRDDIEKGEDGYVVDISL